MILRSDNDIATMGQHALSFRNVDIYLEQLIVEDLRREFKSDDKEHSGKLVLVEEINDISVESITPRRRLNCRKIWVVMWQVMHDIYYINRYKSLISIYNS